MNSIWEEQRVLEEDDSLLAPCGCFTLEWWGRWVWKCDARVEQALVQRTLFSWEVCVDINGVLIRTDFWFSLQYGKIPATGKDEMLRKLSAVTYWSHSSAPWLFMEPRNNKVPGQGRYKSYCNWGVCPPKGHCGTYVSAQDFLLPELCSLSFSWRETVLRCGESRPQSSAAWGCLTPPIPCWRPATHQISTYFTALPLLLQRFPYTQSNSALIKGIQLGRQDMQPEGAIRCVSSYCCNH